MTAEPPFPSRGKGRGWGGGKQLQGEAREALSNDGQGPPASPNPHAASTPPDPPEGFDRFAGPDRIKPGSVRRAKRLRLTPTYTEAKLWERLRGLDIRVRRQAPIGPYVIDFACLRAKLVIEVDGGVHDRPDVAVRDLERDAWLSRQGFRVLRIAGRRVETDLDGVVLEVETAIRASVPTYRQPATTPSQPFPLEGKGFSDV